MRGPWALAGTVAVLSTLVVTGTTGRATADPLPGVTLPGRPLPTPSVTLPLPAPSLPSLPAPSAPAPAPSTPPAAGGPAAGGGSGSGPASGTGTSGPRPKGARPAAPVTKPSPVKPIVAGTPAARELLDDEATPAMRRANEALLVADRQIAAITARQQAMAAAGDGARRAAADYRALGADVQTARARARELQTRHDAAVRTLAAYARKAYRLGSLGSWSTDAADLAAVARRLDDGVARAELRAGTLLARQAAARADYDGYAQRYQQAATALAGVQRRLAALATQRTAALDRARAAQPGEVALHRTRLAESGRLGAQIRAAAAALRAAGRTVTGTGELARPGTGAVTSPYGMRRHPILGYVKMHTGTDFGRGDGTVYAADAGRVLFTMVSKAYGNMTVIDHGIVDGRRVTTLYAHQARFLVAEGQQVRKGQPVGVIGATGYATGPHLHFEVRDDGAPTDPMGWR
jgi:murein DD-endopeptidase MepM/ murein hydrolase activator NlpD